MANEIRRAAFVGALGFPGLSAGTVVLQNGCGVRSY